jgi:DNA repair exonuclease SbcCD ATPase subunit
MMKTFTLLGLCLISLNVIMAQEPIEISEDTLGFGSNSLPALSVIIPEVEFEKTMKNWVKTLESGTRSKVVTENGEMSIFGARIKSISDDPVNVYSKLIYQDQGLNLKSAFEIKKDQYVDKSSGSDDFPKARDYIFNFAKDQYVEVVSEQVKTEQKKLSDLKKELASFERDQAKLERTMRANHTTIASEQNKLTALNNELESISGTITEDSSQPAGMGAAEIKKDYVKDLEKQRNKTLKEIESSEKKIRKAEREIEEARREIPKAVSNQDDIRDQVAEQEAVVKQYVTKLNTIKDYK